MPEPLSGYRVVDMTTAVWETHAAFLEQAKQSRLEPLELVLELLEAQSGAPVPEAALKPVK